MVDSRWSTAISKLAENLYLKAVTRVPQPVKKALKKALAGEKNKIARKILQTILISVKLAEEKIF